MGEKIPLLARAIGGRVLGPRPGKAIVTFWQGIVEIILRCITIVVCVSALVPACVALSSDYAENVKRDVIDAAGLVAGAAVVGIVLEVGLIALRFANVGIINYKIKWLLIVDFLFSCTLGVLLLAGCAASAYASHQTSSTTSQNHTTNNYPVTIANHPGRVVDALIASTVMSFFASISLLVTGVWSIIFMACKWNKHVVTYTLRNAVLG